MPLSRKVASISVTKIPNSVLPLPLMLIGDIGESLFQPIPVDVMVICANKFVEIKKIPKIKKK